MEILKFAVFVLWFYPVTINGNVQRITMNPTYNSLEAGHKYICNFYEYKKCIWQIKNETISLAAINYRYFEENNPCSIIAKNNKIAALNDIECLIYAENPHIINTSKWNRTIIPLHCFPPTHTSCSWKRNNHTVQISGRYKYLKAHQIQDCSFAISKVASIDIGNWQCDSKSTENQNSQTLAIYTLITSEASVTQRSKHYTTNKNNKETTASYEASTVQLSTSGGNDLHQCIQNWIDYRVFNNYNINWNNYSFKQNKAGPEMIN